VPAEAPDLRRYGTRDEYVTDVLGLIDDRRVVLIAELEQREWWNEWSAIRCPVMVVRGAQGDLDLELAQRMDPGAITIPDSGHDVHLDQPEPLGDAIARFLHDMTRLPPGAPG
jgi:pimeloyl-ACP methyl ester carboxylesterase